MSSFGPPLVDFPFPGNRGARAFSLALSSPFRRLRAMIHHARNTALRRAVLHGVPGGVPRVVYRGGIYTLGARLPRREGTLALPPSWVASSSEVGTALDPWPRTFQLFWRVHAQEVSAPQKPPLRGPPVT